MPKFNLAVLLKVQSLWLNTLVFLSTQLIVVPNQIQYTARISEPHVHILRVHCAPKSRVLNVLQIATCKTGN